MELKKISYFNKVDVSGLVEDFSIKTFTTGTKLANIRFKDEVTNNVTYVQIFDREGGIAYGDKRYTLEQLKTIFMDSDDKPRGLYASIRGKGRETQGKSKSGAMTTYTNFTAFQINPTTNEDQHAVLIANGIVESVARLEQDDEDVVKVKLGICNTNKDKDINGCDFITVVGRGKVAEKLEDVERGYALGVQCYIKNELPKRDVFGNKINNGVKEVSIENVVFVRDRDELDDNDFANYQKSKTLAKGVVIKVAKQEAPKEDLDEGLDF